jgi:hypothetical protein
LVSGTLTADSSPGGTVTALAAITVATVVFWGRTLAGSASTKRETTRM